MEHPILVRPTTELLCIPVRVDTGDFGLVMLTRDPEIRVPLFDQNLVNLSFAQT